MNLSQYLLSFAYPPIQACVSYLSAMILLFLDLQGAFFHSPSIVEDQSEFHSLPEAFGHMSPHCQFSDLGSFRLRIFSAQVGNRTHAHGDESNPLEISMSSAMKGELGHATGLTTLGVLHPFICAWQSSHRNLCQARIEPRPKPHSLPTALPRE
jgi:hypothetical protein